MIDMIEITDSVFRKMLDKAGMKDVHLFKDGKTIVTKKGQQVVSVNEMSFGDITKKQWVKTIEYWLSRENNLIDQNHTKRKTKQ